MVALKARESDADSFENKDNLVNLQYKGKEHFKPLYDKLVTEISQFGDNIEIAPKKAYVSLRSKKQFAILNPAAKSRFEIGLIISPISNLLFVAGFKIANCFLLLKLT